MMPRTAFCLVRHLWLCISGLRHHTLVQGTPWQRVCTSCALTVNICFRPICLRCSWTFELWLRFSRFREPLTRWLPFPNYHTLILSLIGILNAAIYIRSKFFHIASVSRWWSGLTTAHEICHLCRHFSKWIKIVISNLFFWLLCCGLIHFFLAFLLFTGKQILSKFKIRKYFRIFRIFFLSLLFTYDITEPNP